MSRFYKNTVLFIVFFIPSMTSFSITSSSSTNQLDLDAAKQIIDSTGNSRVIQSESLIINSALNVGPNTTKEALLGKLEFVLDSLSIDLNTFQQLHYQRNDYQLSQNISYSEVQDTNRFELLGSDQSVFHRIGPGNLGNEKYVSKDGKSEYVFRSVFNRTTLQNEMVLVSNTVNRGTYNFFGPNDAAHLIWDVLPWLIWGNGPGDDTGFSYRRNLYINASTAKAAATVAGKESDLYINAFNEVRFLLADCSCTHTDLNNGTKNNQNPATVVSSGKWLGSLTGVIYDTYVDSNGITRSSRTSITDGVASGSNWDQPIVDGSTTIVLKKPFEDEESSFGTLTVPDNNAPVKRQYFKPGYFGSLNDTSAGTYQYTAWGRWNGSIGVEGDDGDSNFSINVPKGYWVIGDLAKTTVIDKRHGTANYKGNLIGDLLENGSTSVLTAALVGDVAFQINFNENSITDAVSGSLDIRRAITGETWFNESFSGGSLVTHFTDNDGGGTYDLPLIEYETPNAFSGFNDHVSLKGFLYGSTGQELGGSFHIQKNGDLGVGVFRAKEQ